MRAAVLLLVLVGACGDGEPEDCYRRGAPTVPTPEEDARVTHFYRIFTSGEQTEVGGVRIPTWQHIGEAALVGMGRRAIDYWLAPERAKEYRTSPNILSNVLRVLTALPGLRNHPGLQPFLLHWLDPANCPPRREGNDWVNLWRREIFSLFTHYPHTMQAEACIDELDRKQRVHDLRMPSILVLLVTHNPAPVLARYDAFPQDLKNHTLARLHELSAAHRDAADRAVAKVFLPKLRKALDAEDSFERCYAAATLLRLGEPEMAERLLLEFERAERAGNESAAWVAIRALAQDLQDPRALHLCLERAKGSEQTFSSLTANEMLRKYWLQREDVQQLLWGRIDAAKGNRPIELVILSKLIMVDRPRVIKLLKSAILGNNRLWRKDALRFVASPASVPEAGPWIIALLQRTADANQRAAYYFVLVRLRSSAVLPLLRAELDDATDKSLQQVAAESLIALRDKEGIARIAERLADGDAQLLEFIMDRARRMRDPIPDGLVPAVLHVLESASGEGDRLKALYILRVRGRLEGVREGLIEAYRKERSRRVATQIETTLRELAYR